MEEIFSEPDKELLTDFLKRRAVFDTYIANKNLKIYTCPGCGYPTNKTKAEYDICVLCDWEDDGTDDKVKSLFYDFLSTNKISGPNRISPTENRLKISKVLFELANKSNGQLTENPKQVLAIIQKAKKCLKQVYKSIPSTATQSHIGWEEARNVKQDLLKELITTNT